MLVDSITDLVLFTQIVKEGSLSGAARETGVSGAAVTKRLRRLEEQLGVRLINRSTRKLSVTSEGAKYFEYCRRILGQLEEAESVITQHSQCVKGTLRVTMPAYFGREYIAPLMPKFMSRYPSLRLSVDMSDSLTDIIADGYDVALRIGNMKDSNLVATQLGVERRVAVATPDYLQAFGEPRTPEELAGHNALLYANPTPLDLWTFIDPDGVPREVKMSGNFDTNNCESLRNAVLSGLGIALRPTWDVWEEVRTGRLKVLLPDYTPPSFNIQAVYPSRRHLSSKVRAFIELLRDAFDGDSSLYSGAVRGPINEPERQATVIPPAAQLHGAPSLDGGC